MNDSQELTHTVTTTVNATNQNIVNETTLTDGGAVIMRSKNEINLPIGSTYDIAVSGDINSDTIVRTLNVMNNLIGKNTFSFKDTSTATDINTVALTASYNADTMTFSGTAAYGSTVRVFFEDGTSKKVEPDSLGAWTLTITEDDLEYGVNNIVVMSGTSSNQIANFDITKERPFDPAYTYQLATAGDVIGGTVADVRAKIILDFDGALTEITPKTDLTWTYNFAEPLAHGATFDIYTQFGLEFGLTNVVNFYKNSATLDQVAGQQISGTATPSAEVQVTTEKYGVLTDTADAAGNWSITFEQGLPSPSTVAISIAGVAYPLITYTGPANIDGLKVTSVEPSVISGEGYPATTITVTLPDATTQTTQVDSQGKWTLNLVTPLNDLESATVTDGQTIVAAQYVIFEATIVTKTQIVGQAEKGSTVTINGQSTVTNDQNQWEIILTAPLAEGEQITVSSNTGDNVTVTYVTPFTAYLADDGTKVFGTSKEAQVTITLPDTTTQTVDVVAGDWTYTFAAALTAGQQVGVQSGTENKSMSYSAITLFTANLSASNDTVTGDVDAASKIRIVFGDNSMIEANVASGPYSIALGRTLAVGEAIVVACIVGDSVYSAKTIYAA